jgi:hypothetical protein
LAKEKAEAALREEQAKGRVRFPHPDGLCVASLHSRVQCRIVVHLKDESWQKLRDVAEDADKL